jgi:hypothetical protein
MGKTPRPAVVAIGDPQEELVVARRSPVVGLSDRAEHRVGVGRREVRLDVRHRAERIVLPGQDHGPVGPQLSAPPEAGEDRLQLRPGAPFKLDAVVDKLAARGLDLGRPETRDKLIVPHEDHGGGALGERPNEAEHLPGIAVREDEVGDFHLSRKADAGTRTPDPLLTMEVLYRLSYVGGLPARSQVVGGAGFEPA